MCKSINNDNNNNLIAKGKLSLNLIDFLMDGWLNPSNIEGVSKLHNTTLKKYFLDQKTLYKQMSQT